MKLTQVLRVQHMGRMTKFNWFAHARQKLPTSAAEANAIKRGLPVIDPKELLKPPPPPYFKDNSVWEAMVPPIPVKNDVTHPDWKEIPCLKHESNDLLVLGVNQAQVLTKTLYVKNGLPDKIEALIEDTNEDLNKLLERIIYTSNIFDAIQEKLPKKKDPTRPAWNFPRDFGIPDIRKSRNLVVNMVHLCELLSGPSISQQRQIIQNGLIKVPIDKEGDLLMLNMTIEYMITCKNSLTPIDNLESITELTLPDLYPINSVINLQKEHVYQIKNLYPVSVECPYKNVHTIFIYHDKETVKNLTELPAQWNQLEGRSLMKSFTAAAANARQKYGGGVRDLPEPITVQCIQLSRQSFIFSVFQLNTLDINGTEGKCNFWWSTPPMNMFEKALYEQGIPIVVGYNPEVFKRVLAFYKNT